mmetsp:Transcript_12836/g.30008  ORF Transcript_12836/g.30008 Transcript_12836/m.30008 type:complete len:213 (+) Transcript_12836:166-804(+)
MKIAHDNTGKAVTTRTQALVNKRLFTKNKNKTFVMSLEEVCIVRRGAGSGETEPTTSKPHRRMDYDKHRDDQFNTSVISALVGGFSLTNSWELERDGGLLDTVTYLLAIVAVHFCTCSALTSAFLYRSLTRSDPDRAVVWMEKHPIMARMAHCKFVVGVLCYLASIVLVAWKELRFQAYAQVVAVVVGATSCIMAVGTFLFLAIDPPDKIVL